MFSPKVVKIIAKAIKFLEWTRLYPFSWDENKNTIALTKRRSKVRILWIWLFLLQYVVYFSYNMYHLHRALHNEKSSEIIPIMDTIWVGLCAGGHYISLEGIVNYYSKQQEMVTHFRQMLIFEGYQKTFQASDATKRYKFGNRLAIFICRSHVTSCLTLTFMAPILYYVKSAGPQYLYSAWPVKEEETISYCIFFIYEFFGKAMNAAGLFLSQAWFLFSVAYLTLGLSNLRKSSDPLNKKVTYYRCLDLLNGSHNRCYLVTLLPFRFAFYGQFLVGCAFVLIHIPSGGVTFTEKVIMVQILLAFTVTPFLYLHIAGQILQDSRTVRCMLEKEAWANSAGEVKIWRREVKSLKPFGVRVGMIRGISYAALNAFFITVCSILTTVLVAVIQ